MVNGIQATKVVNLTKHGVDDLLSPKQLARIVESCLKTQRYNIDELVLKEATVGLAGYLGDHLRLSILASCDGKQREIKLFIKCMPLYKVKVDFLKNNLFYKREQFVFNELFKQTKGCDGPNQWRPTAFVCNEELVVMPDLAASGYMMRDRGLHFDLRHCLLTLTALANYHAASVDYETKRSGPNRPYTVLDEYGTILEETNFEDSPWLRAGARTTAHLLGILSDKYHRDSEHYKTIEAKLEGVFVATCATIRPYENVVNVVIHKDLWSNNVMFRYDGGVPVNAVLLDFQCVRYAPPAFDITTFLCLNTSRDFRECHERQLLDHYYHRFVNALSPASAARLKDYSVEELQRGVEEARAFGLLVPVMIFPYVMMEPTAAKRTFDDPATYERYNNVDRSAPVAQQAALDPLYRGRLLEVFEEFVEKFVL